LYLPGYPSSSLLKKSNPDTGASFNYRVVYNISRVIQVVLSCFESVRIEITSVIL